MLIKVTDHITRSGEVVMVLVVETENSSKTSPEFINPEEALRWLALTVGRMPCEDSK